MAYYRIKSRLTGYVLDVEGGSRCIGARVIPWDCHGGENQLWYDDPATGTIRAKATQFCLDIENDQLCVREMQPGDPNQQWMRSDQHIRNRRDQNRVLDIMGGSHDKGARISSWQWHGGANQCWDFEFVGGQRREFYIVSEMNKKVVDIQGGNCSAGTKIIMWPKNNPRSKNQLWYQDHQGFLRSALNDMRFANCGNGQPLKMHPASSDPRSQWLIEGNKISNRAGEVLDINQGSHNNGAEVISYCFHGQQNQQWRVEYA